MDGDLKEGRTNEFQFLTCSLVKAFLNSKILQIVNGWVVIQNIDHNQAPLIIS